MRKRTKWERDVMRYGSAEKANAIYENGKRSYNLVLNSHQKQEENLRKIQNSLTNIKCITREKLSEIKKDECNLLVSFGGDNHFVYVAYYANKIPVLGINSNPMSSTGALLNYDTDSFICKMIKLMEIRLSSKLIENFILEYWTRIEGELILFNQKEKIKIGPCISEISVCNSFHDCTSRFLIRKNKEGWEKIKCSGFLLASGSGSSGWYRNAHENPHADQVIFPKSSPFFRGLAREVNWEQRKELRFLNPQMEKEERLDLISEMDGEITVDANTELVYPFPPGARLSFFLSKQKLAVVQ